MSEVEEALKRLAVSVEKNNSKLLPPLPYFNGKGEKFQNASIQDFMHTCKFKFAMQDILM